MILIGEGFRKARAGFNYNAMNGQNPLLAVVIVVVLFGVYSVLQLACGFLAHVMLYGSFPDLENQDTLAQANLTKAVVVGILPAAIVAAVLTWWAAGVFNRSSDRGLPLQSPRLGVGGWGLTLLGFILTMYGVFTITFVVLGIDPSTYMPTSDGISDTRSAAGLIEKTLADLADEPLLFALAVPGIAFAGPVVEEMIFRGAVFSALRQTLLGSSGTVVMTAAVWAMVHGATAPWLFVGLLFVMGLMLGWLLLRFGTLWVPIVCHCIWNGIASFSFYAGVGTP